MTFPKFVYCLSVFLSASALSKSILAEEVPQRASLSQSTSDLTAIEQLRAEISSLKTQYENRIHELEIRLEQLQSEVLQKTPEPEAAAAPAPAPVSQTAPGLLNPAIFAVGNFVGRADSQKVFGETGNRIDNKMLLREAEIDMRVPVDPYADGVLITAIESESPNEFSVGVEEGYVNIKKLPFMDRSPLGLKLKMGRFRPLFGSQNILHTHDLPQTFRPLVIQEFLGPEGFIGHGLSANLFLPSPGDNSNLDFTFEALTGGGLSIAHASNSRMAYLGHLRYFQTLKDTHALQLGWSSYMRPEGNSMRQADMHDIDFMYRWRPNRRGDSKSFLLGGEYLFARRAYPEAYETPDVAASLEGRLPGKGKPSGYYVFTQWQFNQRIYAGLRLDKTDVLFDPALTRRSMTPYVSYYFSEFLRFRLNYEQRWSDLGSENRRKSVFAEINFLIGSHPTEPYWVNR